MKSVSQIILRIEDEKLSVKINGKRKDLMKLIGASIIESQELSGLLSNTLEIISQHQKEHMEKHIEEAISEIILQRPFERRQKKRRVD